MTARVRSASAYERSSAESPPDVAATPPAPAATTPLRVVYFNYEWDLRESSGAATHIAELGDGLRALGHHVVGVGRRAIAPPASDAKPASRAASSGWRGRLSPYLHEAAAVSRALRGIRAEEAILRRERPDVVLTRYSLHQFSSLVAARRLGLPLVFELNAPVGYEYRKYLRQFHLVPGLAEWSEIRTLGAADGMFVVSNPLRDHLIARGLPADHIAVVPNGADADSFRPDVIDHEMRARFGRRVVVGFVGSFASFHGVDTLRRLITSVAPTRPDVAFLLVGGGKLADQLRADCRALGLDDRIHFTGYVTRDRVPALVGAMDIVVAPYQPHDFFYFSPIKLFEYMAAGRAVVAASLGQIAEVLDDSTGRLYHPNDPDALARQVVRLVEDGETRAALGRAARRAAETSYTWAHNAARVAATLHRAVAVHRAAPTSQRNGA